MVFMGELGGGERERENVHVCVLLNEKCHQVMIKEGYIVVFMGELRGGRERECMCFVRRTTQKTTNSQNEPALLAALLSPFCTVSESLTSHSCCERLHVDFH